MITFTHKSIFHTPEATAQTQSAYALLLPFFHIYGLACITLSGLCKGVKIVSFPKFDPASFVGGLAEHKVSTLHLVPSLLAFLLHHPGANGDTLPHADHVVIGAAPVAPSSAEAFVRKMGRDIFIQEGYGMTETLLTHVVPKGVTTIGTCGKVLPDVQVRVVCPDTGENLPAGEAGELWVKTPGMMNGYLNNPEATRETIDEDGWLHTGDIATYDDQELFRIVDRLKELIKVKGLQVRLRLTVFS